MDRSLFVAMSGAKEILLAQNANANNLANVNTTAFKADLEQFRSQPLFGPGHPSRVFAMSERTGVDLSAGPQVTTGRNLDMAINGEGWFAVQAKDGTEAYTRAGELHIDEQGRLLNGQGLPVIGAGGPITLPPADKVDIGIDGTVSIIPQGSNAAGLAQLDQLKLVNPPRSELEKGLDGLMRRASGQPAPANPDVKLASGVLETSNVSSVEEMVRMIELQRHYEMQIKMMKAVEDNEAASAQLMRMG
ncbi:flagellar basal-body rod protein FlgF [Methylococcus sp. EFPC2]|uniref:flagellar basal-body rod protein FlgF n=1 Tax=Methylococcus sp. EFPC2 TaxID=2812648 RepID=UPI00196811B4|nr:flagellar basal-body rod protein FlgF [Methylococcus sp. EFPC2]QSA98371.1 flagellar basal-body rod protein FlgF [Methylococcus sp. EFPC2]